jgi:LuxR family transcriptional regulator, maltose regulon positive regulatory protein
MAEPSAAASAPAGAAERDALLATKLHMPGSRPGQVPRARLTERLDQGLEHGLTLVCAPAGYGKTALLAEWAQRCAPRAAWLSLDGGDNDPARFWRHAVAAMDRVRPGLDARLGPLLGPPAPASLEPLVTTLINELANGGGELVLILDDYHAIESQAVHGSLEFLLEHRSAEVHLVLASRADPPRRWRDCGPVDS